MHAYSRIRGGDGGYECDSCGWCNGRPHEISDMLVYDTEAGTALDELTVKIGSETDDKKRNEMIREAMKIQQDDVGHIPLHQQAMNWGAKKNITLVQWPDNGMAWKYITVK